VDSCIASSHATGLLADARTVVETTGLGSTVTADFFVSTWFPGVIGRNGDRHADTTAALQRCGGDLHKHAATPEPVVDGFNTLCARAVPPRLSR